MPHATPPWFRLAFRLWLVFFLSALVAYWLGAGGVRLGTTRLDFGRGQDVHLRRLNDSLGLEVGKCGDATVSYYHASRLPFGATLGRYVLGRSTVQEQRAPATDACVYYGGSFLHGDWLYTDYPDLNPPVTPDAYNVRTGELVWARGLHRDPASPRVPLATVPEFRARGLLGNPAEKLRPGSPLLAHFAVLDMQRTSLVILNVAFLTVGALLGLTWLLVRRPLPDDGAPEGRSWPQPE